MIVFFTANKDTKGCNIKKKYFKRFGTEIFPFSYIIT